jgi:poly(3-hydroxybutyrate) depolymerase
MLYHWFELSHAALRPARVMAEAMRLSLINPFNPISHMHIGRHASAALEVFERTTRRYAKPVFGLKTTMVDEQPVDVYEEVVWQRPMCRIVRFRRDVSPERAARDPRLLIVAPMSGHFATLLRGTVETFLPSHDVYITDWTDARDLPLAVGRFDLDDYVDYMRDMFRFFGGDVHVFSVCQPSVPVLAATALMEEDGESSVPQTLMLAGGPIDTRVSMTEVNKLAEKRGTEWFANNVITSVPWPNLGCARRVYPGFLQLTGFMTMNLDRHLKAHKDLFFHLVQGDGDSAEKHRDFYDEYLAVMDLTEEFYLQTIDNVFVNHHLPKGMMMHRGRPVKLSKIERIGLMTIEGEKDDITGLGQCAAALPLCSGLPAGDKMHFECPSVGHYGIFNGSRFRSEIAPRMANFMLRYDPRAVGRTTDALGLSPRRGEDSDHAASAFSFSNQIKTRGDQAIKFPANGSTLPN